MRNIGKKKETSQSIVNKDDADTIGFIEIQIKKLKSKRSFTSKRDNAKYPFTYFPS